MDFPDEINITIDKALIKKSGDYNEVYNCPLSRAVQKALGVSRVRVGVGWLEVLNTEGAQVATYLVTPGFTYRDYEKARDNGEPFICTLVKYTRNEDNTR